MLLVLWRRPLADTPAPGPAADPGPQLRRPCWPLVGQTCQTVVPDPWQLFATWAPDCCCRWRRLGRSPLLLDALPGCSASSPWCSHWRLGLIDLFFSFDEEALGWCLTLLNAALWGLLMLAPPATPPDAPWLAGLAAGSGSPCWPCRPCSMPPPLARPAWPGWLAAAYLRWHHRFIAGLAMGCLSLIAVILAALGQVDGARHERLPAALSHRHRPVGAGQPLAATTTEATCLIL